MPPITVIQVLRKEGPNYENIILENSKFLESVKVEYIIYDNLKNFGVLQFIKNIPNLKYYRKVFLNVKTSFFESGLLANGEKIIYLKSDDILNLVNVQHLENIRPHIMKKDLWKIKNLKRENFNYDDFNLLIKEKKSLWEKIKLMFS